MPVLTTVNYIMGSNPVWFFVDRTGQIAVGAWMYTYSATTREPKAVYQNSDGTGPYPNPLPLNILGAAPLYFADDDPLGYYLVVVPEGGDPTDPESILWTIDKYMPPESGGGGGGGTTINNYQNFATNPQFQFNYGERSGIDSIANTPLPIAQNWEFYKNGSGADITITFPTIILGDTLPTGTPVSYLRVQNTNTAVSETFIYVQQFYPKVRIFEQQQLIVQFSGISPESSTVKIVVTQHFGTGGNPSEDVDIVLGNTSFNLSGSWTDYSATGRLPTVSGKVLGTNDDDGVYVRISYPAGHIYDVGIDNFQTRLGNQFVPFTSLPTTADLVTTMGSQIPAPSNGGTDPMDIGNVLTVATAKLTWAPAIPVGFSMFFKGPKAKIPTNVTYEDGTRYDTTAKFSDGIPCKRLYDVIGTTWGNGNDYLWCNVVGNIIQVMNTAGGTVTHASNGTSSPGFSFDIKVDGSGIDYGFIKVFYETNENNISFWTAVNNTVSLPDDSSVQLGSLFKYAYANTLSQGLYIITLSGAVSALNNRYFEFNKGSTGYYVWVNYNSTGTDPALSGKTGIEIDVATTDTLYDVTLKITATCRGAELTYITPVAGSAITAGDYIQIEATGQKIAPWFKKDDEGTAPVVPDYTAIEIDVTESDTQINVATKFAESVNTRYFAVCDTRGGMPMGLPDGSGIDPGVIYRFNANNPSIYGDNVGTYQFDQNRSHNHPLDGVEAGGDPANYITDQEPPTANIQDEGGGYHRSQMPDDGRSRVTPYNFSGYWCIFH